MERDGKNISLWQDVQSVFTSGEKPNPDSKFDVIIVGGGITGVTTAYELQKRGKNCLLAEARNLCFGTSSGTSAHINNFFDTTYAEVASGFSKDAARVLADAARDALKMYKENIEGLKIECEYSTMDGIVYAQNDKQAKELQEMYESAVDAGVEVSYIDHIPIPDSFQRAISFKNQGRLHPVKYVYELARAFEKQGGIILENCFVKDVVENELIELESSLGNLQCEKLIYATHIPPGVNLLHLRCAPYRSYVMAIKLEDDQYPSSAVYDMVDPYHYYRTQEIDNQKFLIAGGEDHKTGHEANTELPFEKLEKHLRNIFNIKEIKYRWSSQYFEPADGLAYIGNLPAASENIFVATGFGGNGITYSHIAAKLLAAKIVQDIDLYDCIFSPDRLKPMTGFSNYVKENADVVSSLIVDPFKISKVENLDSIRNDSADTVKFQHHSLAIYKNQQGEIFSLNPTCTHLKCMVKWNQTERSWDCPCHGARYSVTGEVITGPASKPLARLLLRELVK
jgi:glycine/D-amino acid oxidase-like deaminating enzyme/nitrite reductase/ring-hydroxylating ferredoxin subunit